MRETEAVELLSGLHGYGCQEKENQGLSKGGVSVLSQFLRRKASVESFCGRQVRDLLGGKMVALLTLDGLKSVEVLMRLRRCNRSRR